MAPNFSGGMLFLCRVSFCGSFADLSSCGRVQWCTVYKGPQPRGNSLAKISLGATADVAPGDEGEGLGASILCRRVCRCEFSIFVETGLKIGNLVAFEKIYSVCEGLIV